MLSLWRDQEEWGAWQGGWQAAYLVHSSTEGNGQALGSLLATSVQVRPPPAACRAGGSAENLFLVLQVEGQQFRRS